MYHKSRCVCGKRGSKWCSCCTAQRYCSIKCQRRDWTTHKRACNKTQNSKPEDALSSWATGAQKNTLRMGCGLDEFMKAPLAQQQRECMRLLAAVTTLQPATRGRMRGKREDAWLGPNHILFDTLTAHIIDVGFTVVGCLGSLTHLDLHGTSIDDVGLTAIVFNCHNLIFLDLSGCKDITDVGIASIGRLGSLTYLDLTYTQITDVGLTPIAYGCHNLTHIDLFNSQCDTSAAWGKFQMDRQDGGYFALCTSRMPHAYM